MEMQKQQDPKWFCWVVKSGKFNKVKEYLAYEVPEVVDVYYPVVQKERSVYGKIVVRDVPLFSGYVFLKYSPSEDTFQRIKKHPFITSYLGLSTQEDVDRIESIKKRENNKEFTSKRVFNVDDKILIVNGHFINFKGVIKKIDGERYYVEIGIFNRTVLVSCSINDIVSEDGDLFEW